jgi:ribosome recycling factor
MRNFLILSYRHASNVSKKKSPTTAVTPSALFDAELAETHMKQCLNHYGEALSSLRVGRAMSSLLDSVKLNHQGQIIPLHQVAQITARDPQTLIVSVYDETMISSAEKAIRTADLNLNPMMEHKLIRVPIPRLTKEHREQMAKQINKMAETIKINIREIRQKNMKLLRNNDESFSKDEIRNQEKEVSAIMKIGPIFYRSISYSYISFTETVFFLIVTTFDRSIY